MENREKGFLPLSFGIDLDKKEYVRFFMAVRMFDARYRIKVWLGSTVTTGLLCLLFFSVDASVESLRSPTTLWLLGLLVLAAVLTWAVLPLCTRLQAARQYVTAREDGVDFFGVVTLSEQAIEKKTLSGTVTLPFSEGVMFFETPDMQVFYKPGSRAIVLPARCMTRENADTVRVAAARLAANPPIRQGGQLVPARTEPLPTELPPQKEPLFSVRICYRDDERRVLAREICRRLADGYILPYAFTAFAAALVLGLLDGFSAALIGFWVTVGLLFGILFLRVRQHYHSITDSDTSGYTLSLTDDAIIADGGEGNGRLVLPWEKLRHAVEGEDAVEFYDRRHYIYLPRRCIEDMDAFRALVERCRKRERNG